jgi:phage shock protein PspC (stress-responsive transcriptional regulator)
MATMADERTPGQTSDQTSDEPDPTGDLHGGDPHGGGEPPDLPPSDADAGGPGDVGPGDAAAGAGGPATLRRDTGHQMLGGVAAGLARYLNIDVLFIRLGFAVLTVFWGAGAFLYLAGWLLLPADDDAHPLAQQWMERRPPRRSLVVIVLAAVIGLIALTDVFSSGPWWPHRTGGISFGFGVAALVLAVILVAGSGGDGAGSRTAASRLRWLLLMLTLAATAVVVVVAATVFSIEAVSGVPLRGGIGDTQWHPTSTAQLAPNYRLAVGNLNVDLSGVTFKRGTTHVTATVGIGRLTVEVPPGPTVSVVAHSGLGNVEVFGQNDSGLSTAQSMQSGGAGTHGAHIVLDADSGVGQVVVVRTTSVLS